MTTLANRPNTALLVIDVQNGVVERRSRRATPWSPTSAALVEKARRERGARRLGPALRRRASCRAATSGRSCPSCVRTPSEPLVREALSATPSRRRRSRPCWPGIGVGRLVVAGAQTDECVRSTLHGAHRPRLRRDAGQRRAHDGGPLRLGRAAAGAGHRAHQPLLGQPRRPRGGRPARSRRRTSTSQRPDGPSPAAVRCSACRAFGSCHAGVTADGPRRASTLTHTDQTAAGSCRRSG